MRKIFAAVIITVLISATGCAFREYYLACKADPACVDRADGVKEKTEMVVSTGVSLIPHPAAQAAAPIAAKILGSAAGLVGMLIFGRLITKKKEKTEAIQPAVLATNPH